jgi:hypothetical protein
VNGSQAYYNCQEIDEQVGQLVRLMAIEKESQPQLEAEPHVWLAEMGRREKTLRLAVLE